VHLGASCRVCRGVVVGEASRVLPGTLVPAGMEIPPFSVVGGVPARVLGELPEAAMAHHAALCLDAFLWADE
jgi:dynactin 5